MPKDYSKDKRPDPEEEIIFRHNGLYDLIKISDILFCESEENYSRIYLKGPEKISIICKRLCFLIRKLKKHKNFYRCHKSYLINVDQVTGYTSGNNRKIIIISEYRVPVARKNWKELFPVLVRKRITEVKE